MEHDFNSIARQIAKAAEIAANTIHAPEAKLRELVAPLWKDYLTSQQLDLNLEARDELILAYGRADTIYNRLILEYKRPGSIKQDNGRNRQIIAQVQGYIEDYSKKERWEEASLFGVAFDGVHFLFIHKVRRWIIEEPVAVNADSIERFFLILSKLVGKTALLPKYLIRDFAVGADSEGIASKAIKAFYFALTSNVHPKVKVFFEQWAVQFAEVHGSIEEKKFDDKVLFNQYGFNGEEQRNFSHLAFFYALDTYYALLMKLLAYQVVGFYARIGFGAVPLSDWETLDSKYLQEKIGQIEQGGIFRDQLRIRNFLEGDLLSWYLNDWNPPIEAAIREIIKRLNGYDPQTMELLPDETRDILKKLYQFLVPKKIRHDLGEYYTPDWLAERCLNQVGYGVNDHNLLSKRVLDPGCGSGTFLILAIKRAKENAKRFAISPNKAVDAITKNIVGFDLNPLAVISARTNYLLAIADLLKDQKEILTIPIYLCDSINPPQARIADEMTLFPKREPYEVKTTVGSFYFSHLLVTRQRIQELANLLEQHVKHNAGTEDFLQNVQKELQLSDGEMAESSLYLTDSFEALSRLEAKGINGIWSRIIKNAFAPHFVGSFDVVVGNPPWVNWESLPQSYRDQTLGLWKSYGLFSLSGQEARLGGGKKDISMLMMYVAIDKYLKDKGKCCFVITQTLFKTQGAGDGFRRFKLGPEGACFRIDQLDDMVDLQPFEGATNRTALIQCTKGHPTKYPVPYLLWKRREKGRIALDSTYEEAFAATERKILKAQPVGESITSPWISAGPKALLAIKKVLGRAEYHASAGACTWLNGVFWGKAESRKNNLAFFSNLFEDGKIKVDSVEVEIEALLIYPLLRGREVGRWTSAPKYQMILPQDPKQRSGYEIEWMKGSVPKTLAYLRHFQTQLVERSGYKKYLMGEPFYSIYNVDENSLAKFKVVWKEQSSEFQCAVVSSIGGKPIVPDHKLMLVPFGDESEAHYVCAILNSIISQFVVHAYTISTQQSTHILDNIRIRQYVPSKQAHKDLARLSRLCHEKASMGIDVSDLEDQIDQLAAELWGITNAELKDIKDSLAETR